MVIVVGIVMVMVYSALDRNLIFAADSMYTRVKSNAKEVYMMQQWERYGYVDYVPYSDYMRQLVRDDEITQEQYSAAITFGNKASQDSDEAAENVFLFHHELAVLSGNVLMPLLYHSFRPQSVYLWTIDCKRSGIQKMYESKLALYTALLNGDAPTAVRLTHERITRAIEALPLFGA